MVVRDYDAAIRFFVEALPFELAEDAPSTTNDGCPKRRVIVSPLAPRQAFCLRAPMANAKQE